MGDQPDIFYYNLAIGNNSPNTAGNGIYTQTDATVSANNNIPILQSCDDYYASIIRFQIPAFNIPQIQVLIQTPVLDINKTIYSFTLQYGLFTSPQTFLIYTPEFKNIPPQLLPKVGTPTQTFSDYYFMYYYTTMINMMNTALATATTALNGLSGQNFIAPFFNYDSQTQLISLYADNSTFANSLATPVKIWFNNPTWNYLVGFNADVYYDNNQGFNNPNGLDNLILIQNNNGLNVVPITVPVAYNAIKTTTQYNAYGYWAFLKSIYITTSMNIQNEIFFINNSSTSQNVNYVGVLTDYLPDLSQTGTGGGAGIGNQIFIYNATSLYRMFSFNQKTPLYNFNLGIVFADTYGNTYPLLLDKGMAASFKFMFIKKSIYATMNKNAITF